MAEDARRKQRNPIPGSDGQLKTIREKSPHSEQERERCLVGDEHNVDQSQIVAVAERGAINSFSPRILRWSSSSAVNFIVG